MLIPCHAHKRVTAHVGPLGGQHGSSKFMHCLPWQRSRPVTLRCKAVSSFGRLSNPGGVKLPFGQQQPLVQSWTPNRWQNRKSQRSVVVRLSPTGIVPLGYDFLTFLTTTVLVVPACKYLKISPVLGFLFAGVALEQAGMLRDLKDVEILSELGVLFLLYEQGLELSLDRLKALAKYAFGMGSLQVILSTLLFTAVALPAGFGLGTWFLEHVCGAPPSLVSIRTVDEAVVIAAALSMSSSAFVLQLLSERGEAPTRVGSATLGILLFQDIAVVPFLVLLPLIESNGGMEGASADTLLQMLGPTALTSVAGLAALLVGGRTVLRRIFEMVAESRSNEAFVALCLLTVGGSSLLTKQLGLSDTLGAFIAGVLLAETSFRTQVEADIRPFRGLLIGLFFMSVGGSINMGVLRENYDVILWMLAGLVSLKAAVNTALGPLFGLSKSESIRTGFLLSQGGEFAFVLLSLACQLKLLPEELNQILIITVVFSMALTPALAEVGSKLAEVVEQMDESALAAAAHTDNGQLPLVLEVEDPVVILGFGSQGQMVANMLSSPLAQTDTKQRTYIAFDLNHNRVAASKRAGFNVAYGNGARADVLKAAGVKRPAAVVVCHSNGETAVKAVESLRASFSTLPIYACAHSFRHASELRRGGANHVCIVGSEAGLNLGAQLLADLGTPESGIMLLRRGIGEALAVKTAGSSGSSKSNSNSESPGGLNGSNIHALQAAGTSDDANSNGKQQTGKEAAIEVFVLDGKHAYASWPDTLAAVAAVAAEVEARPVCGDCPLVKHGIAEATYVNSTMEDEAANSECVVAATSSSSSNGVAPAMPLAASGTVMDSNAKA